MHNLHELYFKTEAQFSSPLEVNYIVKESTKFYLEKMGFYRDRMFLILIYIFTSCKICQLLDLPYLSIARSCYLISVFQASLKRSSKLFPFKEHYLLHMLNPFKAYYFPLLKLVSMSLDFCMFSACYFCH